MCIFKINIRNRIGFRAAKKNTQFIIIEDIIGIAGDQIKIAIIVQIARIICGIGWNIA